MLTAGTFTDAGLRTHELFAPDHRVERRRKRRYVAASLLAVVIAGRRRSRRAHRSRGPAALPRPHDGQVPRHREAGKGLRARAGAARRSSDGEEEADARRTLQDPRRARPRRDGHRLQGRGPEPRPGGGAEDHPAVGRRRGAQGLPQALLPRGQGRGQADPPAHRHHLRLRRGGRPRVPRHGAARGRRPAHAHQAGAARRRRRGRHRAAGRRRPGLRARARRRAPRHQARQHHAAAARPGEDHGLRHRAPAQRRLQDQHRHRHGHAALHVARAGGGRPGRPPLRHLLARHGALRDAHRHAACSPARTRRRSRTTSPTSSTCRPRASTPRCRRCSTSRWRAR